MKAPSFHALRPLRSALHRHHSSVAAALMVAAGALLVGCPKDDAQATKEGTPPPPPPPTLSLDAGGVNACASGKGADSDSISAPFFPQSFAGTATSSGFCIDPATDVKTYGDHGKLTMDDVCTTAFDGECEVYKRFGLKRTVSLRYVDDKGKGSTIDAILSQFKTVDGAYGMYTKRVIADSDPTDPTAPRVIPNMNGKSAGAIGTGRAYVWKNDQMLELQYNNENETPEQLAASSEPALTTFAQKVADLLPPGDLPAAAEVLPTDKRVPNGVQFYIKDVMGLTGAGAGAVGYYKDGPKRWRAFAIVGTSEQAAKDSFKAIRSRPGSLPLTLATDGITGVDEAAHVVLEQSKDKPKEEFIVLRRGAEIDAVGDEEYAVDAGGAGRLEKEDATAILKAWTAKPAHAPISANSSNGSNTAATSASAAAAPAPSAASSASRR